MKRSAGETIQSARFIGDESHCCAAVIPAALHEQTSGTGRPFPDDIGNVDRLRNQAKACKAIGNNLLATDCVIIDRNDAVIRAVDETPAGFDVDTGRLGLRLRDFVMMDVGPSAFGCEDGVKPRNQ